MKEIKIGSTSLKVKDYYCSRNQGGNYLSKADDKLWLYVNLTSMCNLNCKFCVNPNNDRNEVIDLDKFKAILTTIKDNISGVSFTGGEPTLFMDLLDKAVAITRCIVGDDVSIYIVTNGTNLSGLLKMESLKYLYDIHISLHSADDNLFDMSLSDFVHALDDNNVVLNCILKDDGVNSVEEIIKYLEFATKNNVTNVSFINLIKANNYCRNNYIDSSKLKLSDERIKVITERYDYNYCHCCNYIYEDGDKYVRFYIRFPSNAQCPYTRQMVYDSDNKLKAGFNGKVIE